MGTHQKVIVDGEILKIHTDMKMKKFMADTVVVLADVVRSINEVRADVKEVRTDVIKM